MGILYLLLRLYYKGVGIDFWVVLVICELNVGEVCYGVFFVNLIGISDWGGYGIY